ncbi:MAG: replicative DNA helicase [Chloroflexi bacterium]|nr:replicative DNA helicase [Chloroflexota bacterium]
MSNPESQTTFVAPHSVEAEEALLGAILINPDAMVDVIGFLRGEDFFILRHQWLWMAMVRLHERGEAIDNLTTAQELRDLNRLEDIGGTAYIAYLINNTPTSLHAEVYGRIIERAAIRRRILEAAGDIAQIANTEDVDINEVIDRAEATLFAVTEQKSKKDMLSIRRAITDYFERVEYLYEHRDEPLGTPTGFNDLDKLLGGLQKSDLTILAARPGMGKTSLILNIAVNAARVSGARVAVFSLEMSTEQLIQRLIAAETGINTQLLRSGQLDERQWDLFVQATGTLGNLPVFLDDTPAISPLQMRGKCRRLYREYGLDLVVVDYLQLMSSAGVARRSENRVQEVSAISRNLKELARELNVPVLAASQLSRAVEQRGDKRPVLSDLRESGSIEQDADVVMFIYRDEVYNEDTERPNQADVIVAKHRNGPVGTITLYFKKELTQFANLKQTDVDLSGF